MPAWTLSRDAKVIVAILLLLWVAMALHTALAMRRHGRRWWVWFPICAFCSIVPAVIVSCADHFRQHRPPNRQAAAGEGPRQCPHCHTMLNPPGEAGPEAAPPRCPNCNGPIDDTRLA